MKMKKLFLFLSFAIALVVISAVVLADSADVKYCCEKTNYGAWCQNTPKEQCNGNFRSTPTSCEATSFCELGCCYDSSEGTCMENTPQKVCQDSGGTWGKGKDCNIPQCNLGCCVLGKQASFVTLTRCKKLSAFYGLETDFRASIKNELTCLAVASVSDEGACVYEVDYTKTCRYTTRQGCIAIQAGTKASNGTVTGNVSFYKDYLCSAEELGNVCGLTKETICLEGRDEVYFKDSCGNAANIYDASKINDKAYWRKKVAKEDSCNPSGSNADSAGCGNCNYFEGSICKDAGKTTTKPSYGNNVCANLNCKTTSLGKSMKHGESWCETDNLINSVGSRYYRHICMNGEEIVEPCADFRQEVCIQDKIVSKGVTFAQAGCRANRWQQCYAQKEKADCENTDKRDCIWTSNKEKVKVNDSDGALACVPKNPPGFNFWSEDATVKSACAQANKQCTVSFEEKLLGSATCKEGCDCLDSSWKNTQLTRCGTIGDCGAKVNYLGQQGNKKGYNLETSNLSEGEDESWLGGLF